MNYINLKSLEFVLTLVAQQNQTKMRYRHDQAENMLHFVSLPNKGNSKSSAKVSFVYSHTTVENRA